LATYLSFSPLKVTKLGRMNKLFSAFTLKLIKPKHNKESQIYGH